MGIPYQADHRQRVGPARIERLKGNPLDEAEAEPRQRRRARGETGSLLASGQSKAKPGGSLGCRGGRQAPAEGRLMGGACWANDGPVQTTKDGARGRQSHMVGPAVLPVWSRQAASASPGVPVSNASFSPHPRATQRGTP